jgi:prepilin-type N-terminal cleavage/methylation domain-containing protein
MPGQVFAMSSRFVMPRPRARLTSARARRGFTLPEILIVIVMISVLALVAIPRFATANGKRHMESARMRVAAALATARAAAIQKGEPVRFRIASNRVTVKSTSADTTNLVSPIPLDTLYDVRVTSPTGTIVVDFSARGFASYGSLLNIKLRRPGVSDDSVLVTTTGMVQR